jgi:hypothetical protein
MSEKTIVATFSQEEDLLAAVRTLRNRDCHIVDIYAPYVVHGLEEALGWPRSRLPVACFLCGAAGVGLALWFQFWTTAYDWPLNVGGRPWNSLPAFVPVTFETMVLLAGFGLVFAWLFRCGLYPGKQAALPFDKLADDRFIVVVRVFSLGADIGAVTRAFEECHAASLEERIEEKLE